MNDKKESFDVVKKACKEAEKQMMKARLQEAGCVKHEIKYALNNL